MLNKEQDPFSVKELVWLTPLDLCRRILVSFIPPVSIKYTKLFTDLLGPVFAVFFLTLLLNYGYSNREKIILLAPIETILLYISIMPVISFFLNKLGQSTLTFLQVFSLIGYGLYGHILTLVVSLLYFSENSDAFFFLCLIVFAGSSTLRLVLLQSQYMPLPGARLLVCSFISTVHILFLIFIHFVYMHPNFNYHHGPK